MKLSLAVTPIAVTRDTAASMLAMSLDSFERNVQPEIRLIRRGRLRLVPVAELERWARETAELVLPDDQEDRRA